MNTLQITTRKHTQLCSSFMTFIGNRSKWILLFFSLFQKSKTIFLIGLLITGAFLLNSPESVGQTGGNGNPCGLNCRDTTICFNLPDSMVRPPRPTVGDPSAPSIHCQYDSIWFVSPGVYPVGVTVITWYITMPGGLIIDSCTSNITRRPPTPTNLIFSTSPPIVGGAINICNGQSITFTISNLSTGITGWLWNFGNGYYSTNSPHTEPASHYPPGTYYDTLTYYDDCGFAHDTAFQVVVDSASGPDIYCISTVCPGDTVTYHTNSNCTTYNWAVTNGTFYPTPTLTSDSATVVWGNGPSGTIALSVSGCTPPSTCAIATIKKVNIVPATLPVSGDTIVCAGSTITYCIECIPGNTHSWEVLPAGAGTVTGQNTCCITITLNPTFVGPITIQVNYNNVLTGSGCSLPDGCTHDQGCGGTGLLTVHVRPIFGIAGPAKVCPNSISSPFFGKNLTLNLIEPLTTWKLVSPSSTVVYTGNTAGLNLYTWNAGPGIYRLTAYAPLNTYCNDSATVSVEVVNMLNPGIITGPDTVCANVTTFYNITPNMGGVTYNWSVTGGVLIPPLNGSSIGVQWLPGGGTLTVTQTLSASPFCVSVSSPIKVVKTWPIFALPVITPSGPIACLKGNITYSIPPSLISNATYTWSVVPATAGNIITANGTNTITIKWIDNSSTPIFVKLKITRCYSDSVLLPITLFSLPPVPNISFLPATPCVSTPVSFFTSSLPTWNWSFGDGGVSTLQNPVYTYNTPGDYNVQLYVTNPQGCSDTANTKIHIDGKPVVPNISGPSSICLNSTTFHSFPEPLYPGALYTWSLSAPALGIVQSSSNNFINIKWTSPGIDTLKLRVQAQCMDTTLKFVVTVNPLPVAGISVPSPACEGTALTFNGTGGVSYSWLFTGGSPSSSGLQNPVVSYSTKGNYGVSLTVTDANGCVATKNITVTINPKPIAVITGPFQICSFPATVTIAAVAQAGYTFAWTPSNPPTPSISPTINAATTFSVVVTNAFGCTRTSNSITVDTSLCPPPDTLGCPVSDTINFISTPPICLTDSFIKTGNAILTGWEFGDGGTAGAVSPVTHTYAIPGIYLVTVKGYATALNGAGLPCTKIVQKSKFVTIPFDAHFDFAFQCAGPVMQTIFTNTSLYLNSPGGYTWSWRDVTNANALLSSLPFPGPITLTPGVHVISLNIFDPITGATCTILQTLNVPTPIVANFSVASPVCQNASTVLTDLTNPINLSTRLFTAYLAGPTSNLPAPSFIYPTAGAATASLTVTDIYGCSSTLNQNVTVLSAGTGTLTVGTSSCDSVQLTASPSGPYTWSIVSPTPAPFANPIYVKQSGFYKVTGVSGNGCPYTAGPVFVTVKQSPVATISGKTLYCQGEKLDLKTSSSGSIVWTQFIPFGGNVGFLPNLNVIPPGTGLFTYKVTVTGANGCSSTSTIQIKVDAVPPNPFIVGGPLTFCDGDSVLLTVNPPGATYLWSKSPTPPLSSPADTNDSLIAKLSGTYSVIVQTPNGCAYPAIPPVVVTVNPNPPVTISGDTVLCVGDNLILQTTPVGGATFAWSGPGGTQNTNPYVKPNVQLSDAGVYTVIVTNTSTGCTSSASITVYVNPAPVTPVVTSNPGGVLCEGQLYTLTASPFPNPPVYYNWSTGQMGAVITAVRPGDYYVTAINQFGCTATSNIVTIHPLPDLSCVPTGCYDFCEDCNFVTIPAPAGFAFYTWQKLVGNNFVFYSATQNLQVFPPGGKFRLLAANAWGCSDSTDTLDIMFHTCCPPIDSSLCADTCTNFNNNNLNGFIPNPAAPNVIVAINNIFSQGGATDYYVSVQDQPGPSQLLAGSQFNGKWCCGEFCFDYKLFDDGATGANVNPAFVIKNGLLGFTFTSTVVANQANGWHNVCAPITDCSSPPITTSGVWAPIAGTVLADWPTVLSYVTEVNFKVDYTVAANEVSNYDNVCIHSTLPSIDAGADDTICAGEAAILHVTGCNGVPQWFEINGGGVNFFVGAGPQLDVFPTTSTCYMVVCCGVAPCCCDTDTVCIIVNPLPSLQWPTIYPPVCLNSAPVFLDASTILVYYGGNWVPVTSTNGTGSFSGVGVVGNFFTPSTLGTFTISYCYTDSNGCSSCITNTIKVITCCNSTDPTCQIDAGPDQSICIGQPAILNVANCNSIAEWYELDLNGGGGPIFVGTGQIVDVFPQQNTCYIVICCNPAPCCCDTDTVCITVNPLPMLQWPTIYPNVCLNSPPVFLDANNILVFVGGNWVPVTSTTGTGFFSGPGVVGNNFYPTSLGTFTITYCYTDPNGCTACVTNTITVIDCGTGCDNGPACQIDAGPDQTICAGQPAILNVQNCNSVASWLEIGVAGNTFVGIGQTIDVFPQQNTCYMVICCNPAPCCCDTDTVCITVNPLPVLHWTNVYPDVCLNSAPVFLDASNVFVWIGGNWVPVTSTTGTWYFSGPGVVGNFFTPSTLGLNTITFCYTDPNGCTSCITNTINVINCCNSTDPFCNIDAGPDQTICLGQPAILHVNGCNSVAQWYQLGEGGGPGGPGGGPIFVGTGETIDVFPQQSTCYIVICCNPAPCCCDTDTVCITVNPLPILHWTNVYPDVCLNSTPVFLDASNVFVWIGGNWVPVTSTTGTWYFSGPGVVGNFFTPSALGLHTITFCYTDPNGCTSCITNTINVINCCNSTDPFCNIDAGPDQSICLGQPAILQVNGCNSEAQWYQLGVEGPVFVGIGQILDVFPQQSTCYIVICCNPAPCCCDTDTVCITVNPLPLLHWTNVYPPVCLNSSPVFLDASNIFVFVGGNWIPVTASGGTGYFSGTGVAGNYFYPTSLGTFTITYCYTDPNGCTSCITNTITVIDCGGGCDTSQACQISAGPDQTICAGQPATLHVNGCNSIASWFKLGDGGPVGGGGGPVFVGTGETIDIFPQYSACYIVICCNPAPCCCDTDTVCITVNPLPYLYWPTVFETVCLNSAPVFLDANDILTYYNFSWVPVTTAPGTGFFAGTGVAGNYFYPTTLGLHTITYYYTDENGCTGSVTNRILVIDCGTGCDTSTACQINAGPDQTICLGQPAILQVNGCNSVASWFELSEVVATPVFVGTGEILDVFPQHSTCYIVICCNPAPCCCDTDTVCITVRPLPVLYWAVSYAEVCLNAAPIFLDANNIFVNVGNTWVPVPSAGGGGYFSGAGVLGNYFYPSTLGPNIITYTYTDQYGCTNSVTNVINVIDCGCNQVSCNCDAIPPPPLPTITITGIDPDDCSLGGCIHVTFTGCCLLYSYTYYDPCRPELSYSVAQTSDPSIFCGLRAGSYTIYAQDACGNLVQQNVVVPLMNGPLDGTVQYPTTCGGTICVTGTGGCPPYSYSWLGGNTTECLTGAEPCTETYVTITDSRGCSVTKFILVPGITFTNVVQPSCCLANGSICANVCFGPRPYIYRWNTSPPQFTECIRGLLPGTYCLTVTNALGQTIQCCYTLDAAPVTAPLVSFIYSNCGNSVTAVVNEASCQGYTYHWENNSTELIRDNIQGCDSLTFTIVTCDGHITNYGFKVPHLYPAITPVNCLTGLGAICVPVECFRCEPFTYTWSPMLPNCTVNGNCLIGPPGHYTVCITNACGDVVCCQVYLPPPLPTDCGVHVDINIYIEGYYTGSGLMDNYGLGGCLYLSLVPGASPTDVDSVFVTAVDQLSLTPVEQQVGILQTNGSLNVTFTNAVIAGNSYYLKINQRNSVETWSQAITLPPVIPYDFSISSSQAFGDNQREVEPGVWAIYSGDIDDGSFTPLQDGYVDAFDFLGMDIAIQGGYSGYNPNDLNGDGFIDAYDFLILDPNIQTGIGLITPP